MSEGVEQRPETDGDTYNFLEIEVRTISINDMLWVIKDSVLR